MAVSLLRLCCSRQHLSYFHVNRGSVGQTIRRVIDYNLFWHEALTDSQLVAKVASDVHVLKFEFIVLNHRHVHAIIFGDSGAARNNDRRMRIVDMETSFGIRTGFQYVLLIVDANFRLQSSRGGVETHLCTFHSQACPFTFSSWKES